MMKSLLHQRSGGLPAVPPAGEATAMFVGATRYSGPRSIIAHTGSYLRMVRRMTHMTGYRWHTVYYRFPFTLGTIAFFSDRDALLKFARSKHHRDLMCWVTDGTRNATGGFIRLYNADPEDPPVRGRRGR